MKTIWFTVGIALVCAASATQAQQHAVADAEEVEVYTKAVSALLVSPQSSGDFYLAGRIVGEGFRLISSSAPEEVRAEMESAGYRVELAELAENGLWQVPRGSLFFMLRPINWWPGGKIAVFSLYVGSGTDDLKEVAFKFRKEESGWVLIEKGPAESGS